MHYVAILPRLASDEMEADHRVRKAGQQVEVEYFLILFLAHVLQSK